MDFKTAALIVVDLQEDFCRPNGSLGLEGGREIAPLINTLLQLPWRLKIATQDWHPSDHVSFASSHASSSRKPGEVLLLQNPLNANEERPIRLYPDHCVQNTKGAELIPELDTSGIQHIVQKGQDKRTEMFSAFQDTFRSPCVSSSNLLALLTEAGIASVFVVGLAANVCVKETALHAAEHGFSTTVLRDATVASDCSKPAMKSLSDDFARHDVRFCTSKDAELTASM